MPIRFPDRKQCTKCKVIKPYSEFYISRAKLDGYTFSCKDCNKAYFKVYGEKNLVKEITRFRKYYNENRESVLKRNRDYVKAGRRKTKPDPYKELARRLLHYAVKTGRVIKKPCEVCGKTDRIHGHHEDYTKPIEVVWLCAKHHMERHRKYDLDKIISLSNKDIT